MRGAAGEVRQRDGGELRRAERLRHGEVASAGARRCAGVRQRGGRRSSSAAGMITSHASTPSASIAVRQS